MKRSVHTECEMVKAVQELESGIDAETVARNHGISKATLYNWKSKYSGIEVSQVRRLKELEEENRKLKQMYAELALDNKILKDVIEKNSRARGKERAGMWWWRCLRRWVRVVSILCRCLGSFIGIIIFRKILLT